MTVGTCFDDCFLSPSVVYTLGELPNPFWVETYNFLSVDFGSPHSNGKGGMGRGKRMGGVSSRKTKRAEDENQPSSKSSFATWPHSRLLLAIFIIHSWGCIGEIENKSKIVCTTQELRQRPPEIWRQSAARGKKFRKIEKEEKGKKANAIISREIFSNFSSCIGDAPPPSKRARQAAAKM